MSPMKSMEPITIVRCDTRSVSFECTGKHFDRVSKETVCGETKHVDDVFEHGFTRDAPDVGAPIAYARICLTADELKALTSAMESRTRIVGEPGLKRREG